MYNEVQPPAWEYGDYYKEGKSVYHTYIADKIYYNIFLEYDRFHSDAYNFFSYFLQKYLYASVSNC